MPSNNIRIRTATARSATASAVAITLTIVAAGCARARPAVRPSPPDPLRQLQSDINAFIDAPGVQRATWGIVIHSLARDERLHELNARKLLIPASTMKLVTVAAAAEAVGWDFTFETTLLAAGAISNGVLQGDLVVTGSGDPTVLGRAGESDFSAWIHAVRQHGIRRVEGRIVGDDNAVEEPRPGFAWAWNDLGYTYGALAGALNLSENRVEFTVRPAAAEGLPAFVEGEERASDLPFANRTVTGPAGSSELLWPEMRPGDTHLTITGSIPLGAKPATVSVATGNPTIWFARALRHQLLSSGITVLGYAVDVDDMETRPDGSLGTVIHTHRSQPLREIVKPLLKDSINLYAEAVLRLATGPAGARTTDEGVAATRRRLETWGVPADGIQMVDGSGLSRRDVVAPDTLLAILQRMHDPSGSSPWMQALAVAGRDGTLDARLKGTPAEGNVIAKTGSLSNVRTLAGYVRTADGEPLAFVIMVNNFEGAPSAATGAIDRVVTSLASFSRAGRRSGPGRDGWQ
jgi:D-alanyl-D-alanine carboxypeptidase/D-alanyl-D-alanine-endopeptidase (penicillin-binding protein 4)